MLLLVDVHVPDEVTEVFRERGHEIVHARDNFPENTPDEILAQWGHENGAILVTWDRDFRGKWIKRAAHGERERFYNLGRISFVRCPYARALGRVQQVIDLIEFEFQQVQKRADRRLIIEIGLNHFTVWR